VIELYDSPTTTLPLLSQALLMFFLIQLADYLVSAVHYSRAFKRLRLRVGYVIALIAILISPFTNPLAAVRLED
jgi:purine-cytosine permease-like protein